MSNRGASAIHTHIISITEASQLEQLRQLPQGHFRLETDIDLEGAVWEPFFFDGILDGCGHSISNLKIPGADENGCQGFFSTLGENACVTGLQLLRLAITGDPGAVCIGAVAGRNAGAILDCRVGADAPYAPIRSKKRNYLTGYGDSSYLFDRRTDGVQIGAIAGVNNGQIRNAVSYLRLLTDPKLHTYGLFGSGTGSAEGLWRDCSHRSELLPASAVTMRKNIVRYMEDMGNLCWIPTKDMAFTTASPNGTDVVYKKDVLQYGLPYTQTFGCLERAEFILERDGCVAEWIPDFSDAADKDHLHPLPAWDVFLGNDCSGAVYWAWSRSCTSVCFEVTNQMMPTAENMPLYGVLPVGDYRTDSEDSPAVIAANGQDTIMACYAQLHLGDAIIMRYPDRGHTRLVSEDPMVMRREDGSIDPDASYVPTHEQGVGNRSSGRESTWQLRGRYTFRELLIDYLPVTTRELQRGIPEPVRLHTEGITSPVSGRIRSNYRIISSTVKLTNCETGKPYESTLFTATIRKGPDIPFPENINERATVRTVDLAEHGRIFRALPQGLYDACVSVQFSNGQSKEVYAGLWQVEAQRSTHSDPKGVF